MLGRREVRHIVHGDGFPMSVRNFLMVDMVITHLVEDLIYFPTSCWIWAHKNISIVLPLSS